MTHLCIGKDSTRLVIHEDLLCANSLFFRQLLQPGRKDFEGVCSICLETLSHIPQETTFCKFCGNNFHRGCVRNLKLQMAAGDQQMSCPLCRHEWIHHISYQFKQLSETNAAVSGTYYEWLYKECITYTKDSEEENNEQVLRNLLTTYQLGVEFEDEKFCSAVIKQIVEFAVSDSLSGCECIEDIYGKDTEDYPSIRQLLVYLYIFLRIEDESWDYAKTWNDLASEFVRDVVVTLIQDPLRESGIDMQTIQRRMRAYKKR